MKLKKIKFIILTSAIILSMALGIQAHTYESFAETQETLASVSPEKDSVQIIKKGIDLSTGIHMKYVEVGNPNGRTILFIHGYTDTSRSFEKVMAELLEADPSLRLIAPDLRGHGDSSTPAPDNSNPFEIKDFVSDILELLKFKNITKVELVGHSMGSVIAQEIALEHPNKVSSLTMIGAFMNGKENSAIHDFLLPELIGKWEHVLKEEFGENWKVKSYTLTPKDLGTEVTEFLKENWVTDIDSDPSFLNDIYLETIEVPLATWIGALNSLSKVDNSSRFKSLKIPSLIIWGSGDEVTAKPDQDRLLSHCKAAHNKNATPIYFRNYGVDRVENKLPGHNMHWGNSKEVAADILEFIGSSQPFEAEDSKVETICFN
ncbi:2-succinyl-6-hydroxy-2,4-cyclohexadiene-1-carboxylate synthase [Flagellimonas maritima]|uniref:2-succinyl-6-hydroxy-2, 4-cyclohexadiene-1-carboxylate synthase n=1 Tax=Flagellimonas maritima TaxID=1383885 RepID=A0A2Z4LUN8_9FLAO|nr:alpha/beta hydrolase [Allomuricauda aurantiaca]AWX45007.1 2-succinyl-6-hydroxy-2,4-cyclohexadiene-1-carboxylate synthase [Allomuricauda aurantiaca]